MTVEEARECLREVLQELTNDEYPLVWIGEVVKETPEEYFIEGNICNEETMSSMLVRAFAVHKTRRDVRMVLLP